MKSSFDDVNIKNVKTILMEYLGKSLLTPVLYNLQVLLCL